MSALGLPGCAAFNESLRGQPDFDITLLLPPDAVAMLNRINNPTSPAVPAPIPIAPTTDCGKAFSDPTDKITRDVCVKELIDIIDIQYAEYKRNLVKVVNSGDLAADILILGLGSATTLVPGKTTKSILGAISAGIGGSRTAINADVLYNSSILIIINQMDTDRATLHCTILTQLKNDTPKRAGTTALTPTKLTVTATTTVASANLQPTVKPITTTTQVVTDPPQTYSMVDASSDLILYYQAGTFTHALQALEAKTGSQATNSKNTVTNIKTGKTSSSTTNSTTTNQGNNSKSQSATDSAQTCTS